jgi:small subunit ribosomal protein S17
MNQIYSGIVVATNQKDTKTVSVEITFHHRHPKYQKVIKSRKKIKAHNEENLLLRDGEKVIIKAGRPYSKTKRFLVVEKVNT